MASVRGARELQARLHAIGGTEFGAKFMQRLGTSAVAEEKRLVRRKTGNTGRSIHLASHDATHATTAAGGAAVFLEHGTRPHEITPRAKRALRFAASAAGRRLTGSPRIGADVVFATRVHHPGTQAAPFMVPGAQKALEKAGMADLVIKEWNGAA